MTTIKHFQNLRDKKSRYAKVQGPRRTLVELQVLQQRSAVQDDLDTHMAENYDMLQKSYSSMTRNQAAAGLAFPTQSSAMAGASNLSTGFGINEVRSPSTVAGNPWPATNPVGGEQPKSP